MGWQPALFWGSLISGALAIWIGTRKPRRKRNVRTSYDWRRDSQWRSFM
jgi:hypothetical protein